MSDPIKFTSTEEIYNKLAAEMAAKMDELVAAAITAHLRTDDWTVDGLEGRCSRVTHENGTEYLFLDDVPILAYRMPSLEFNGGDAKSVLQYKLL